MSLGTGERIKAGRLQVDRKAIFKDLALISKFAQVAKLFIRSHQDASLLKNILCHKIISPYYDYRQELDAFQKILDVILADKAFVECKKL